MNGPSPLQRSSWKAEAIRRGDLKISGPIPITEDLPLNEEEEREFAEKGGLDASLQSQDAPQEDPRPQTPEQTTQPPPSILEPSSALRSNPVESDSPQREKVHERQPSRSPPRVQQVNEAARESVIQPSSYTSPTPLRSTPESTTKAAQKKKRKSGLRGVFRKMFGRKSRGEYEEQEQETVRRGHSYHHSDPGMLRQSPPREQKSNGPRISDLPVEELKPLHPLGQHLPFPMNVNAPQASPPQEYLTFDMQRPDIGRRRATLPSVPSASVHRHSLDESRGRLSTWEERQDEDPEPSPGIGIALSSPTQATTPRQSKRRSRSADALRDLVKNHAPLDRRRSAEIRYWRESYMSGSVYSRPQTAKTVETLRSVQMQEPVIQEPESESVIEMSATLVQADEPETPELEHVDREQETERVVQAPVSAFNFGNLKSAPEPQHEAPPPPPRSQQRPTVEDRMQHLESKLENMEFSVRRLSTRNNRQTIILENAPKNLRTRNRSSSSRSASASRSRSTPSIHQEPNHQSSSDTLNPGPTSPVLAHLAGAGGDGEEASKHALKTMYEALKYERSARKALEQQVRTLQHDISDLHALVNKLIASATATSPSYPTPSPDTLITSTEERLLTPKALRTGSFDEAYAQGKTDNCESVGSKFSRSETGSESGYDYGVDERSAKGSYDELATPDVWATPKEEGFGGSGFFHPHEQRSRDNLKSYA
ncbi:Nn.00g002310.m01.CDS01 [Neocucurbitaria sp. VM-36]